MEKKGKEAKNAYVGTYLLNTPFWTLYNILPFILLKDMGATPFQITLMATLKPVVSIFSVYWSQYVSNRGDRLVPNITLGLILGHLPFFFFPWVENIWFFIGAFVFHMFLHRGVMPAWMEILKLHAKEGTREKIVAFGLSTAYMGSVVFPVFFGWMLDSYEQIWRVLFPIFSLISLVSLYFQLKIPSDRPLSVEVSPPSLSDPWKNMWGLMKARPDYRKFQIGFMLGGFGIMVIQPALPAFFMQVLAINYLGLGVATTMCKGIGFAATSGLWARWIGKTDIFRFSAAVVFLFSFFPLMLYGAEYSIWLLYAAYIGYGFMQAGSELAWKLSGPIFAKDEDSSVFSSVNLFAVGLRGIVANPLGGFVAAYYGPSSVMFLGCLFCLLATVQLHGARKVLAAPHQPVPLD